MNSVCERPFYRRSPVLLRRRTLQFLILERLCRSHSSISAGFACCAILISAGNQTTLINDKLSPLMCCPNIVTVSMCQAHKISQVLSTKVMVQMGPGCTIQLMIV